MVVPTAMVVAAPPALTPVAVAIAVATRTVPADIAQTAIPVTPAACPLQHAPCTPCSITPSITALCTCTPLFGTLHLHAPSFGPDFGCTATATGMIIM